MTLAAHQEGWIPAGHGPWGMIVMRPGVMPRAATLEQFLEELAGVALLDGGDVLGRPGGDDRAAAGAALRARGR